MELQKHITLKRTKLLKQPNNNQHFFLVKIILSFQLQTKKN